MNFSSILLATVYSSGLSSPRNDISPRYCLGNPTYLEPQHFVDDGAAYFASTPCLFHLWRFVKLGNRGDEAFDLTDTGVRSVDEVRSIVQELMYPHSSDVVQLGNHEELRVPVERAFYLLQILYDLGFLPRTQHRNMRELPRVFAIRSFSMTIARDPIIMPLIRKIASEAHTAHLGKFVHLVSQLGLMTGQTWFWFVFS